MSRLNVFKILTISSLFLLASCSSMGAGSKGEAGQGEGANGLAESDLDSMRESRFGEGSVPSAEDGGIFRDVRFGYDSSEINDLARMDIEYNLEILQTNPNIAIQLEGHCDERGTSEYNMALGERRATAVREILNSYGIDRSRLKTISYGEELPLENAESEAAFEKNRRVHFTGFSDKAQLNPEFAY